MDIMLVSDCIEGDHPVAQAAERAACRVIKQVGPNDEAAHYVERMKPDALVVVSDEMDRAILGELRAVRLINPLPVLIFTRDGAPESIDAAVKAGASSYIIDCSDLLLTKIRQQIGIRKFIDEGKHFADDVRGFPKTISIAGAGRGVETV